MRLVHRMRIKFQVENIEKVHSSSHRRCSVNKGALENFGNFTRKTPLLECLFNNVAGLGTPFFTELPVAASGSHNIFLEKITYSHVPNSVETVG